MSYSVYVVVVTYNAMQWADRCFESLRNSKYPIKTIVVDNGSNDGTTDFVKLHYPDCVIIHPKTNLGFGKGNNVGISAAIEKGADFIFLLNQDAYIYPETVERLVDAFIQNPAVGLISPIHLAGDERNLDFGFYKYMDPKDTPFFLGDMLKGKFDTAYETRYVNAAAWMLQASMVKQIGMFHPIFDHYGEDREYISRMERAGYKSMISSRSYIVHDRPQSRKGNLYHQYGQTIARDLLQELLEKKISYSKASYRLFTLFFRNLVTLEFQKAILIFYRWRWVTKKNREL